MSDIVSFQKLFSEREQDKDYIVYNGKKVYRFDTYTLKGKHRLVFTVLSVDSPYEQAVVLMLGDFKGHIYQDGKELPFKKTTFSAMTFWIGNGKYLELVVDLIDGDIGICNGTALEDLPFCEYLIRGSAMAIEQISPNKKRYSCNDLDLDDDLNDLVFELEID